MYRNLAMNLQQLRYITEVVHRGLSVSAAAEALHTSQPGVSKQIKSLEEELGIEIFVRSGKRISAVTEAGQAVVDIARRMVAEAQNMKRAGEEFAARDTGRLIVATTHTQARYALPSVIAAFRRSYPKVQLTLLQGHPGEIAAMVARGDAHVAIATEALDQFPDLMALPGYSWHHAVVVPAHHPLLRAKRLTLEDLARHPIVTYSQEFAGRSHIDDAFAARGIEIDIVLAALDADVIKTYVELGLGVGIMAAMAYDAKRDRGLRAIDAAHLFRTQTTRIAFKRGAFLRGYEYDFIALFSPGLSRRAIERAAAGEGHSYDI